MFWSLVKTIYLIRIEELEERDLWPVWGLMASPHIKAETAYISGWRRIISRSRITSHIHELTLTVDKEFHWDLELKL